MPKRKFFIKFFLLLLTLALFLPASAAPPVAASPVAAPANALAPLAAYRWQARLLLVFTPSLDALAWQRQLADLQADVTALAERRLRVVVSTANAVYWLQFLDNEARVLRPARLQPAVDLPDAATLRSVYGLESTAAAVWLVGLDGGVKARYALPVGLGEVFAEIDRMPMRQWEQRQR